MKDYVSCFIAILLVVSFDIPTKDSDKAQSKHMIGQPNTLILASYRKMVTWISW